MVGRICVQATLPGIRQFSKVSKGGEAWAGRNLTQGHYKGEHVAPITLTEVKEAAALLSQYIPPCRVVPMTHSDVDRALRNVLPSRGDHATTFKFLNRIYDLENWLKTNNLVVADAAGPRETGSYKENGALFAAYQLKKGLGSATKLVTASAGNHALGVARASNILDLDATIVVPTTAPLVKVNTIHTILRRGAEEAKSRNVVRVKELVQYGDNFDQANAFAQALAADKGLTFLSPYNDRNVWLGQTYNLESAREDISRVLGGLNPSQVVVPIGGGGFACGVGQLAKLIYPGVRVTGTEPSSHAKFSSLEPPKSYLDMLQSPGGTIADGTATKAYGDKTFAELSRTVDGFESVSEDAIRDSIAFMYAAKGIVAEGSGALGIAMIMQVASRSTHRLLSNPSRESVLTFVSGRNINPDVLDGILRERGIVVSGA